jgi:hypothetical protein
MTWNQNIWHEMIFLCFPDINHIIFVIRSIFSLHILLVIEIEVWNFLTPTLQYIGLVIEVHINTEPKCICQHCMVSNVWQTIVEQAFEWGF